jgi:Sigma-70 region 2
VGARERFEALYEAHAGAVRTYLRRRGADPSAADDLVADVFLVVWRRWTMYPLTRFPGCLGSRGARLRTIVAATRGESRCAPG